MIYCTVIIKNGLKYLFAYAPKFDTNKQYFLCQQAAA